MVSLRQNPHGRLKRLQTSQQFVLRSDSILSYSLRINSQGLVWWTLSDIYRILLEYVRFSLFCAYLLSSSLPVYGTSRWFTNSLFSFLATAITSLLQAMRVDPSLTFGLHDCGCCSCTSSLLSVSSASKSVQCHNCCASPFKLSTYQRKPLC
jgi:hypothetical protein